MKSLGFKSKVFLAPMAGVTDVPMRKVVSSIGGGVLMAEMVAINAISYKNPKSYKIADVRGEPYPVVVQLLGNDPELFKQVVPLIEELGAYSIDVNMGCPVRKIVGNNMGSDLMKDMKLASEIIKALAQTSKLKISVKFRKGWDNNSINAPDFAKMCEDSGASYVAVHGRTRSEMYSGKADWDIIRRVKEAVKIPVIGNGDITSHLLAEKMIDETGVDGVMIGRGALGNPWLVPQIHEYLETGVEPVKPSVEDIKKVLLKHIDELVKFYDERIALSVSRKYASWYSKDLYDAKRFRERYNQINNFEEAISEINSYFDFAADKGRDENDDKETFDINYE